MSGYKKGKTGQQNSKQQKPAQFSNQQKGSKPPQSHPTVYNVKTKSFIPVPTIHKTVIQNVVYVNAVPAGSGVTIVQNNQIRANDKPKNYQKTKLSNPAPKQPNKATDVKQSKPYVQPAKREPYVQVKPHVQQAKTTVHKHIHDHQHIHTHQTAKKPTGKTIVHKHVHIHT